MLNNQYLKDWSKIVKGTEKGSWKLLWLELFKSLKEVIPNDWQVIVSADRGLYADWLFLEICSLNWHPFLRINHQGTYQIKGEQEWKCLDTVVPNTGMSWSGNVTCFKSNPLDCTLLARSETLTPLPQQVFFTRRGKIAFC